jgi:hypothetical protein
MEAWDAPRAERAVPAFVATHGHADAFEVLWPLAARCYAFIGHKIIYAAQVERVLARIGWRFAEPALRSLVLAALVQRDTESHDENRERARALPEGWSRGHEDPARSAVLLAGLRAASPAGAADVVAAALRDGVGPRTLWDALRLGGAEVFARRTGRSAASGRAALLPVHAVTVVNAFHHAFHAARESGTRALLVLQAAAWLAALREDLGRIVGLGRPRAIDALAAPAPDWDGLRAALFRTGQEHHQHKYAAALAEDVGHTHPRWAASLAATAAEYLADPAAPETEVHRRTRAALRRAGIAAA